MSFDLNFAVTHQFSKDITSVEEVVEKNLFVPFWILVKSTAPTPAQILERLVNHAIGKQHRNLKNINIYVNQ